MHLKNFNLLIYRADRFKLISLRILLQKCHVLYRRKLRHVKN